MNVDLTERQIVIIAATHFRRATDLLKNTSPNYQPFEAKRNAEEAIHELQEAIRLYSHLPSQKGDKE